MPAKETYEKVSGKKLSDEQYSKIQERAKPSLNDTPIVAAADGTQHSTAWPTNPYVAAEAGQGPIAAPVIGHTVPPVDVSQYAMGMTNQQTGTGLVSQVSPLVFLAPVGGAPIPSAPAGFLLAERNGPSDPTTQQSMPAQMAAAIKKAEAAKQIK
jgi:hypothetical protein